MSLLHIEKLSCSYGRKQVLHNVSLTVEPGQLVCLLGANGCGKTTLLKCIGNMLPYEGRITYTAYTDAGVSPDSRDLDLHRLSARELSRRISFIPQVSGISIDLSCLDVVLMGYNPVLGVLERPSPAMKDHAAAVLGQLGLGDCVHENFQELSQGQKQLCLLARTMISDAPFLLLDEPERALDFGNRYAILRRLRKYIGSTKGALITLHDPQLALNYCDRIAVLANQRCSSVFSPAEASMAEMEAALSEIYGPVRLDSCYNRSEQKQYVVLAVDEV